MAINKTFIDPQKLKKLSIDQIVAFLEKHGWIQAEHPNKRIFVFEGPLDDDGNPLQLILPIHCQFEDSNNRLVEALNLLAVVEEKTPDFLIQMILEGDLIRNDLTAQVSQKGVQKEKRPAKGQDHLRKKVS